MIDKMIEKDNNFIWSIIWKVKKPLNVSVDDLYQESIISYITVINKLEIKTVDKTRMQYAYLKKAIFNHLVNYLNNQNIELNDFDDDVSEADIDLTLYMLELSNIEQYVIQRKVLNGNAGYKKIGEELGKNKGTVRSIYNNALIKLRDILESDFKQLGGANENF